ncbi:MAG TPA: Imm49 family immunity protein [Williamwhitmania sp.]|nr:Imm49 family immunity protein [Williamwhitmania sp.]
MQAYDGLEQSFKDDRTREIWKLDKIKDPKEWPFHIGSFEYLNTTFALHAMYVERDFVKARGYFYTTARLSEYMLKRPGGGQIETSVPRIGYALFSDNKDIIARFCRMKTSSSETWIGNIYIHTIQSMLLGDAEQLHHWMSRYEQRFTKKKEMTYMGCLEVLKGIDINDISLVEAGVNNLIKTHKRRPAIETVDPYFSIFAATMAKLAWVKGLEVKVDNPLVPMELLPVRPLDNYADAYDFLKED